MTTPTTPTTGALWAEQPPETRRIGALLRAAWQHASTTDAARAETEATLLEARAQALRAEARALAAHAEMVRSRAAVDELRTVLKRWFSDAHAGLSLRQAMEGIGGDLQGVLDIADDRPSAREAEARLILAAELKLPEQAVKLIKERKDSHA